MLRSISYKESELIPTINYIAEKIDRMDTEITMMEEQGLNLRDNLDWASSGKVLRIQLEDIKRQFCLFGVVQIPFSHVNFDSYESHFPDRVRRNFNKKAER